MRIDLKGTHFPKRVILYVIFFYVCYPAPIAIFRKLWLNVG